MGQCTHATHQVTKGSQKKKALAKQQVPDTNGKNNNVAMHPTIPHTIFVRPPI
jgi:hypothetical protein